MSIEMGQQDDIAPRDSEPGVAEGGIYRLQRFFGYWQFPALVVSILMTYGVLILAVLFLPAPPSLQQFAEDFKVWCFGYDPATGKMEQAYVTMSLAEPLVLGTLTYVVWRKALHEAARARPLALVPYVVTGVAFVLVIASLLVRREARASDAELPFPATALRTSHPPPPLALTDQDGAPVTLEALRGKVVMLTGVYSSCGLTCPRILAQGRKAVSTLTEPERRDVAVLAVTIDPEHDGRDQLAALSRAQGLAAPVYHFLWGAPAEVDKTLDALEIARRRDAKTGQIDHANVFVLVDRFGKVAYRLSLGEGQDNKWLSDALRTLLREPPPEAVHGR